MLSATLALTPAGASAASPRSVDTSADLSALNAYHLYLSALTAAAPTAAARAGLVISGVANTCSDGLTNLSQLSSSQLKKSALTAFGREVDADLDLAYVGADSTALTRFASTLGGLTWSTPTQLDTTLRLITGERAMEGTAPANLCRDAIALDAAPLSEPTTTKRFLGRYRSASSTLSADLAAFQTLLARFETRSESQLVEQIDVMVTEYSTQSSSTEQADANSILSELGVDG